MKIILQKLFAGALRDANNGVTEISMNNRLVFPINATRYVFLSPIARTNMKFVIWKSPQPQTLLQFHVLQVFDRASRWAYLLASMIYIFFCWLLNNLWIKLFVKKNEKDDFLKTVLTTLAVQSSNSAAIEKNIPSHQKVMLATLLFFSLVKCSAFQGEIVKHLTNRPTSNDINTLKELLQSNLNLTAMIVIPDLFKPNENESNVNQMQKRLYMRQTVQTNLDVKGLERILMMPNQAVLSESL